MLSAPPTAPDVRNWSRLCDDPQTAQGVGEADRARLRAMGLLDARGEPRTRRALQFLLGACMTLACACGGDPFTLDPGRDLGPSCSACAEGDSGAIGVDAARAEAGVAPAGDAALDAGALARSDAGCCDAAALDGSVDGGLDALDSTAPPGDAPGDRVDASVEDAAPPAPDGGVDAGPLCCSGAPFCGAGAALCYPSGTRCSATYQGLADGGGYQTFACAGAALGCGDPACTLQGTCLYAGPMPGQWLSGTLGPCR